MLTGKYSGIESNNSNSNENNDKILCIIGLYYNNYPSIAFLTAAEPTF